MVDVIRVPAGVETHVLTEPVEGGSCECGGTCVSLVVEVVTPQRCSHLLLCVVCSRCQRGRSIPWT